MRAIAPLGCLLACAAHAAATPATARSSAHVVMRAGPKQPGKRRLETRGEISAARKAVGGRVLADGRVASILHARTRSALYGRVPLPPQPHAYRTGLSASDEATWLSVVDSHFTFAPLRPADEAAFVAALAAVGASRAQGLGLRNGLYRERQAAAEPRLDGAISDGRDSISDGRECAWPCLPEVAAACGAPPLAVLRRMVSREGRLSPRLSAALVEAIIEAHDRWVDVKHSFGRGDSARVRGQVERYCTDSLRLIEANQY
ncbi:hypothetical protein EMIHUDRAFT_95819 [Emiliania huxleyi CCMP1516]|uniref:Uncharacterized protein n=2 Tax=Emiliania huxleyi TaxID=2903 RepID=A0A0D3J3A0_EMIH1|nr:hypothetical protein EMIHUDRAFT_95819 [Emiliania huxleyi CCMP1516]EOD17985.1 hypothetical protein EMIHUDRAFT_95819 [Emiliania huxleyi CCMP1516]|eukprot:XP_005770414.1 hypothetical protein EMIHUDRAFT_95819 [Emiliania huxleyi CCMP1516]